MASQIHFSTNPADWEKLEGLYVNEKDPPGFIRGVDLSAIGIAGKTIRGPLTPQRITSKARFLEVYGGRDFATSGALENEVWRALLNKPFGAITVRRVLAAGATTATVNLDDTSGAGGTNIVSVSASSPGKWGNTADGGLSVSVEAATDGDGTHWNLRIKYQGKHWLYENIDTSAGKNNLLAVIGDDIGNPVVVTKLADGRPHNQSDTALVGGAEGSVANSDYISAITDLANYKGLGVCLVAEAAPTQSVLNSTIVTLASQVSDRIFLTWSGVHGQTPSQEITNLAAQITTRSDRIVWCYNSAKTLDPTTGTKIDAAPHVWMASILSQTDVDVHPGAFETSKHLAGISELRNETLTRQDLIDLRAAGISTLERTDDGYQFRSGVTTSLQPGKTEIARRRQADFLTLSATGRLKYFVKAKGTLANRAQMAGEVIDFSQGLKEQERIIQSFEILQEEVNTEADRGRGIEKLLWRVRIINHMLAVVLETDIGTGVTIEAQS